MDRQIESRAAGDIGEAVGAGDRQNSVGRASEVDFVAGSVPRQVESSGRLNFAEE